MTSFQTMIDQATKKSWLGNQDIIKMSASDRAAFLIKSTLKDENRQMTNQELMEATGLTYGQLRKGLDEIKNDPEVYKKTKSVSVKGRIRLWGIK